MTARLDSAAPTGYTLPHAAGMGLSHSHLGAQVPVPRKSGPNDDLRVVTLKVPKALYLAYMIEASKRSAKEGRRVGHSEVMLETLSRHAPKGG